MSAGFADHFSGAADGYAAYRPVYPAGLFEFLADEAPARERAWDCGTGSGQAACALAAHFDLVVASDASPAQVARREPAEHVRYVVAAAEAASLAARSVDLVTVAQALHWFDRTRFFAEVRRVARPGALFATWTYNFGTVDAEVDRALLALRARIEDFWPRGREHVNSDYRHLIVPFPAVPAPAFELTASWTVDELLGYLRTWSSVSRFRAQHGSDPVDAVEGDLRAAWPAGERRLKRWPLTLRVARIPS